MRWLLVGLLVLAVFAPVGAAAQGQSPLRIDAPTSGQVLNGLVNVTGSSAVDGFFASELSFAYASDSAPTWFLIYSSDQPVTDGLLAAWDTNTVTDGVYNLRLRVTLQDGSTLETTVSGLRIRNQTPTETPTLAPTATPDFVRAGMTPIPATPLPAATWTPLPTPTDLPRNPATVLPAELTSSLGRGIALAFLSFLAIGIFLRLRR